MTLWVAGSLAAAQSVTDCGTGTPYRAPAAFLVYECDSVCTVSGDTLTCDLEQGGSVSDTSLTVVQDFDGTGDKTFSAWGWSNGTSYFCCFLDDEATDDIDWVWALGTDSTSIDDVINLHYTPNGTNVEVRSFAAGFDGADDIGGSDHDDAGCDPVFACFDDHLDGGNGADTIDGYDGDDLIDGGAGADVLQGAGGFDVIDAWGGADELYGGQGTDYLNGGDGDDYLEGNNGDDHVNGDGNADIVRGGAGADVLTGGGAADFLCGGTGSGDSFDPGSGADTLWSPPSASAPTGTSDGSDHCGDDSHGSSWAGGSCTYDVTSEPAECS